MGAWGTSLYANDAACDIRGEYVDKLRRGKTNEEVTNSLIEENKEIMGDMEEEPLFWYALADTQWNYGRLLPFVKEKALGYIDCPDELERWREAGEKKADAWEKTRLKLKEKLLSEQPPEKKVSAYRLYKCEWQLGDVFAYQLHGDYSKEKGLTGQYIVFRKVEEDTYWPGHIVPVIQVYKWIWKELPELNDLRDKELLIQNMVPKTLLYKPNHKPEYVIKMISTSKRVIPKKHLTFLGNISGDDLIPLRGDDYLTSYISVGWDEKTYNRKFEKYIIDQYFAWKSID